MLIISYIFFIYSVLFYKWTFHLYQIWWDGVRLINHKGIAEAANIPPDWFYNDHLGFCSGFLFGLIEGGEKEMSKLKMSHWYEHDMFFSVYWWKTFYFGIDTSIEI